MQQDTGTQAKPAVPPYLPYKTFRTFIDSLKQSIPTRIDRSLMGSMSGNYQAGLIAALRYLELIHEHGAPTERLKGIVNSEGVERQRLMREMLTASYGFLLSDGFDLAHATGQAFDERFREVASGDTVRKSETFFLAAAKDADMPVSRFITARGSRGLRGTNGGRAKGRRAPAANGATADVPPAPSPKRVDPPPSSGNTKTVELQGGGTVTISISVDLFALSKSDRDFVLTLIDRMNEYGSPAQANSGAPATFSGPTQQELPGGDASRLEATA